MKSSNYFLLLLLSFVFIQLSYAQETEKLMLSGQSVEDNVSWDFYCTGGHGAGLDDYWNLMLSNPLSAGLFLWDFSDEAVVRTDKDGILDSDKASGADGILGPYREKEGSFYTIKEIWSPIFVEKKYLTPAWNG